MFGSACTATSTVTVHSSSPHLPDHGVGVLTSTLVSYNLVSVRTSLRTSPSPVGLRTSPSTSVDLHGWTGAGQSAGGVVAVGAVTSVAVGAVGAVPSMRAWALTPTQETYGSTCGATDLTFDETHHLEKMWTGASSFTASTCCIFVRG